jgi:hypothetical protein
LCPLIIRWCWRWGSNHKLLIINSMLLILRCRECRKYNDSRPSLPAIARLESQSPTRNRLSDPSRRIGLTGTDGQEWGPAEGTQAAAGFFVFSFSSHWALGTTSPRLVAQSASLSTWSQVNSTRAKSGAERVSGRTDDPQRAATVQGLSNVFTKPPKRTVWTPVSADARPLTAMAAPSFGIVAGYFALPWMWFLQCPNNWGRE